MLACEGEPPLRDVSDTPQAPVCVALVPAAVRFEQIGDRVEVKLSRCGGPSVDVLDVHLEGEGFSLPDLEATPWRLSEWGRAIGVRYDGAPDARGVLVVRSEAGTHRVMLIGPAVVCPTAQVLEAPAQVRPLDGLALRAQAGTAVRWRWTVTERPPGSTAAVLEHFHDPAQPEAGGWIDDETTPEAAFFVDLAGAYTFALTVADAQGLEAPGPACPSDAQARIQAVPDAAVHVQLVWQAQSDAPLAMGSDLDLHLLHPDAPACSYANAQPDWPPEGPAGDPSLDLDDVDGAGPENINLRQPTPGATYEIAVHAFRLAESSNGSQTPTEATVRLYLNGEASAEWVHTFDQSAQWWTAAHVHTEPLRWTTP
jgi:hypothetical protein